jgi:hypothetical protein
MLPKGQVLKFSRKYLTSKVQSWSARSPHALYFEVVLFTKLYKENTLYGTLPKNPLILRHEVLQTPG